MIGSIVLCVPKSVWSSDVCWLFIWRIKNVNSINHWCAIRSEETVIYKFSEFYLSIKLILLPILQQPPIVASYRMIQRNAKTRRPLARGLVSQHISHTARNKVKGNELRAHKLINLVYKDQKVGVPLGSHHDYLRCALWLVLQIGINFIWFLPLIN